ncbi:MAG: N-acyl homoserine lactonase family protein [Dehalococcoidia bacterium]|nr:N-acyl homoserine lactonase family protein [Dehalococcoidia bacterium]
MKSFVVRPIPLFEIVLDKSNMTYRMNAGQPMTMPGYVWFIEGPKEKILVDAGGDMALFHSRGIPAKELQTLEQGLGKLGLKPEDIDILIATHLHHDHIAHARELRRAKVIVQKKELEFSRNPHPMFSRVCIKEHLDGLKFEVVDGDAHVVEGVDLLFTPGHAAGGQSVVVQTAKGKVVIAGMCTIRDNFDPPADMIPLLPVIAPAIHINVIEAYESALRIKNTADIIVPLHAPEYLEQKSIP